MITEDHPLIQAIIGVRQARFAEDLRTFETDHEKSRIRSIRFEAADNAIIDCARAVMTALRQGREVEITPGTREFMAKASIVVYATSVEIDHVMSTNLQLPWVEDQKQISPQIGSLEGRPIYLGIRAASVRGIRVVFVDPDGDVVDWKQVRSWIERVAPDARILNSILNLPSEL